MIEIKFKTSEGEKHTGIIPTNIASSIQDACELISSNATLQMATIYGIKQADIADIVNITDGDYCNDQLTIDDGVYYKCVVKYMSVDDKVAKYTFVVWATSIDDARDRAKYIIEQNGLSFAEIVKLEKSTITCVMDETWFDIQLEVSAIMANEEVSLDTAKGLHANGGYVVRTHEAIRLMNLVKRGTGRVGYEKYCECEQPMYYDEDTKQWICTCCGNAE